MRTSPADVEKTGLCDLDVDAALDIAPPAPLLQSPVRPPKRRFTEIADSDGDDPDSDELYGWVEDDEVAAEGLIIGEEPFIDDLDTAGPGASGPQDQGNASQHESTTAL